MHFSEIIKTPILTEKTYKLMESGVYTFLVDERANKVHIRKVFETIFEVKVASVNIINQDGKAKRMGRYEGKTSSFKKAIIKLQKGEVLNLFANENEEAGN